MEIAVTPQKHSEITLKIALTKEEQQQYYEEARKALSANTDVPGFRPGFAPLYELIARLGEEAVLQMFHRIALPKSYLRAISEQKLQPISSPKIKIIKEDPLIYEAHVALLPPIDVKGYKEVKIEKVDSAVSDKEIEEVIEELRKSRSTKKPVPRAVQKGDFMEIDFQGSDEKGVKLENAASKNHPLIVGEGSLVRGFEDELLGLQQGEKKKFWITFPNDHPHKPFQNKKIEFDVTVNKVEEVLLPAIDAVFIESVYGKGFIPADAEHFRKRLADDLAIQKATDGETGRKNQLIEKWTNLAKVEIPSLLTEEEIDFMVEEAKINFRNRGLNFDQYAARTEKERGKTMRELYRPEAEKRIKIRLVIQNIIAQEGITVEQDELKGVKQEDIPSRKNQIQLAKLFSRFL